jgi:hypothetical protein
MTDLNNPVLSNANAVASTKGVINGDNPYTPISVAKDEAKLYCGSGQYNKKNGTVNLESILGKSRFDK